jgi:ribosome-associated translation inhibitor RaiA
MEIPLQITNRNVDMSEAIEMKLRKEAGKLDKIYDRIMRCRAVVESPHRHIIRAGYTVSIFT